MADAANAQLRRELRLREAVALGVGGTVGGGVYVLVGAAAAEAGPAALVSFAIAFVAAILIALPYAELACRFPLAGGGYAFARSVLGRHVGFFMGWGFWGAYVFISGYVTLGFGGYLELLTGIPRTAGAAAIVVASLLLNLLGVRISGRVQACVVVAAIAALALFAAWGMSSIDSENLRPFVPHGVAGVMSASLLAFLAFGGFDMVAAAGEEVERPERNLARAILITLAIVCALYLFACFVALGVAGPALLGASSSPLADAAGRLGGQAGRHLVTAAALLTTAATANAILVVTSRIAFAMGRDGLLPGRLGHASKRGAPARALWLSAALMLVVAATGSVGMAARAGGFLYVLHFLVPLVVLVVLRRRAETTGAGFRTPAPRLVLPLAFAACAVLLVASGASGALTGCAWLALGGVLYAVRLSRDRRSSKAAFEAARF
jgi:basic amino acid/polyamine antiporter, APA family